MLWVSNWLAVRWGQWERDRAEKRRLEGMSPEQREAHRLEEEKTNQLVREVTEEHFRRKREREKKPPGA